ncbi:response regulator [soil metagenome]
MIKKKLACVLLIDDDEPTNFISKMLIEEADCAEHIQVVQSGQDALNYLTNDEGFAGENKAFPKPDLIFLDINMPAMNGWEFLDKYNQLDQAHKGDIIVVMLTTSLNPDDRLKAGEMPAISGFEAKPLTFEKLKTMLEKYLPYASYSIACRKELS